MSNHLEIVDLMNKNAALVKALEFALEILELDMSRKGLDHSNATPDSAIGMARSALAIYRKDS